MSLLLPETLTTIISSVVDRILPDPQARDRAKLALLQFQGTQEMELLRAQLSAILAEAQSSDPWTSRARPMFLYVMYAMILMAVPMGIVAAISPHTASAVAEGMNGYLGGLPEPLYALFGTGYLGYATLRQWGKAKGIDR